MKRAMAITMTMVMILATGTASIFAKGHPQGIKNNDNGTATRRVAQEAMCLGMDLRHAEWMIRIATVDPKLAGAAEDAIDAVLYHLDGTEEGEILWEVLEDETATFDDIGTAVRKVIVALMGKYQGEQQWAFYTGSVLVDIEYFALTGDEESLANTVEQFNDVIARAEGYLSDEEMKPLKELQALVTAQVGSEDDLAAIDVEVGNFLDLYFTEA